MRLSFKSVSDLRAWSSERGKNDNPNKNFANPKMFDRLANEKLKISIVIVRPSRCMNGELYNEKLVRRKIQWHQARI